MHETHTLAADPAAAQLHRRIKRGIVASYIHEVSARHNGSAAHDHVAAGSPDERDEQQDS